MKTIYVGNLPFSASEDQIRQLFELEDFGESDAVDHHRRLDQQLKS